MKNPSSLVTVYGSRFTVYGLRAFFNQNRVAELVRQVAARVKLQSRAPERLLVEEGAQQFVVARARLVRAREDRVHDAQAARRAEALRGDAFASAHRAAFVRGVFERAHHGR